MDSVSPRQFDELPGFRISYDDFLRVEPRKLWWEKARVWSGLQRLAGHCHGRPPKDLVSMTGQYDAEKCRPAYIGADFGEYLDLEMASRQAARLTSLRGKPLLILSRDPDLRTGQMNLEDVKVLVAWDREQEALKSLSQMNWRVIARGSGHDIYDTRPDVFIGEVTRLLTYLHDGRAPQFGTTTIE
jgi:hypothetical protein